ncbi:3-methyladenine DNA glycosylase, partial [Mycobacterium sp. ITM-2017-0098]
PSVRHSRVPLRLGPAGTDAVVESMPLRCSHFDAYRFFTESAAPRNAQPLTRQTQVATEQPGCIHAGMDLYKWAFKLGPLIESSL